MKTLTALGLALSLGIGSANADTDRLQQTNDGYDPRPEATGDTSHGCRRTSTNEIECWKCWPSEEENMTICEFSYPGK